MSGLIYSTAVFDPAVSLPYVPCAIHCATEADVHVKIRICVRTQTSSLSVHHTESLGVTIEDKLNFSEHTQVISKKANKRMFVLRKLKKCKVNQNILSMFYHCAIQSVMLYNSICFFGNTKQCDKDKLERANTMVSKIIGQEHLSLESKTEVNIRRKIKKVVSDPLHPLQAFVERFSRHPNRLISCKSRTDRYKNSFLPTAVRFFNEK